MSEILSSAQMRSIEATAIASGAVSGLELMERAGRGVAGAIFETWPELLAAPGRAVVLCGPGNNGGDGYVVARLLAGRGWQVAVFALGDPSRLPPDAAANHAAVAGQVDIQPLQSVRAEDFAGAALVVDALFGTGLTRAVPPQVETALRLASGCRLVAVDMLSGLDADTGHLHGSPDYPDTRAALTVSFECAKLGHYSGQGPGRSGRLAVVPLGLAAAVAQAARGGGIARLVTGESLKPGLLCKAGSGHKYSHGHALVLSGGVGRGGAARLAARAALRMGAGLVTLACPPAALIENAARLDAVMLRGLADGAPLAPDARVSALCLGPGLGHTRAGARVPEALATGLPVVLDADALSGFADDPQALFAGLHAGCVLTPHGGEFARLFPDLGAELAASPPRLPRSEATRRAAERAGAVVLLKGADTVIAHPGGALAIHAAAYGRAAPWLATAGAGDVLAGMIAGLLARGLPAFEAATHAAFLHVEAARRCGPGLIAEDLPEALPQVLRELCA